MTSLNPIDEIKDLLQKCSHEQKQEVFKLLRQEFVIHPLESQLNTTAEVILEAFSKASDLTLRGIRGIIAEATFTVNIANTLEGWKNITPDGALPYDCLLSDGKKNVRVQIKMQRLKDHKPMFANQGYRYLPNDSYVVETQRTRGGKDTSGSDTRPYKFGEFDILGVCLHPSTNNWTDFSFTVADWLVPNPENPALILKFQPVSTKEDGNWTHNFLQCVEWLRSGITKKIWAPENTNKSS